MWNWGDDARVKCLDGLDLTGDVRERREVLDDVCKHNIVRDNTSPRIHDRECVALSRGFLRPNAAQKSLTTLHTYRGSCAAQLAPAVVQRTSSLHQQPSDENQQPKASFTSSLHQQPKERLLDANAHVFWKDPGIFAHSNCSCLHTATAHVGVKMKSSMAIATEMFLLMQEDTTPCQSRQ